MSSAEYREHLQQLRLQQYAYAMRVTPTPPEERLWRALRAMQLGVRFRRQVVVGYSIVDFLAPSLKLVVEIDGRYHERRRAVDLTRERALVSAGYTVLRLPAQLVMFQLEEALQRVRCSLSR